jgi:hypothetical protein
LRPSDISNFILYNKKIKTLEQLFLSEIKEKTTSSYRNSVSPNSSTELQVLRLFKSEKNQFDFLSFFIFKQDQTEAKKYYLYNIYQRKGL